MAGSVLVVVEHDRGTVARATFEALTVAGRSAIVSTPLTIGADADAIAVELAGYGVTTVHQAHDELLVDYGPEAWGEVVAQAVRALAPDVVLATGTDRGNEVLAQAAARLDLPFAANCTELGDGEPLRAHPSAMGRFAARAGDAVGRRQARHRRPPRRRRRTGADPGRGGSGDAERRRSTRRCHASW